MSCTASCRRKWDRVAPHCGACHQTFGSLHAFDVHRGTKRSKIEPTGKPSARGCYKPGDVGLALRQGMWRDTGRGAWTRTEPQGVGAGTTEASSAILGGLVGRQMGPGEEVAQEPTTGQSGYMVNQG